jgi:hypothetical protein
MALMAEGVGFEPTLRFPVNTLSKRAPSATRPPLRKSGAHHSRRDPSGNAPLASYFEALPPHFKGAVASAAFRLLQSTDAAHILSP